MADEIFKPSSKVRFGFRGRLFLISNPCSKIVSTERVKYVTKFILDWESPWDVSCSWDLDERSSDDEILYWFWLKLSCSWSVCKEKMLIHDCAMQCVFIDRFSCGYHLSYSDSRRELSVSQLSFVCLHCKSGSWCIKSEVEFACIDESTLREEVEVSWVELRIR